MDLKALIAKMDQIESKKLLTEGEDRKPAKKQEREVELPSGAKVKATKVQGWQSQKADKEADKEKKKTDESIVYRSAIAQELLREFNLEEAPAQNPWANDPEKSKAWAALTPQDQQWLGGADPTDPYILARAPNKGKPAAPAAPAAAPAADPTDPSSAAAVNGMDKASDDAAAAAAATKPAATTAKPPAGGAGGDAAVEATRKRMKELLDKLSKTGGVSGAAAAPAAKPPVGGKPAAGAKMPAVDQMGNPTPGA